MPNTIRIKRSTGSTAPASLQNAELAYSEGGDKLYIGVGTGGSGGSATTIYQIASGSLFTNRAANLVYAGPSTGSAAAPTFRSLVAADIPTHTHAISDITNLTTTLAGKADLSGATFTGAVNLGSSATATSPLTSDNSTAVATTAWVKSQGYGTSNSTVTSVGLSLPNIFTVTGSPVTTTGTLTATLASQTAGTVFAAPSGAAGSPTFRALVAGDIPALDASKITTGSLSIDRIADSTVTYSKIQNVSATDRLLGRSSVGAGVIQEITCTAAGRALIDDATAADQRTTLGLGTAATSATTDFAAASHAHGSITTDGKFTGAFFGQFLRIGTNQTIISQSSVDAGDVQVIANGSSATIVQEAASFLQYLGTSDVDGARGVLGVPSNADLTSISNGLAAKANLSGATFTGDIAMSLNRITGLADPNQPQDAATRNYVDSVAQGLDVKPSVVAATTANITLSGTQTIDDIAVAAGDRVLVKNQTTQSQNGIYVVAAGSWTRATDFDSWTEIPGSFFFVERGTVNGDNGWVCTADRGGTLGTTAITFSQFSGAGQVTDGSGLSKSGNTLNVVAGTGITVANDDVALTGQALALHNLSTNGVIVRTGSATVAGRTITGTTGSVTVTNGDGVSGNPTISLDATLAALAGVTTAADQIIYATGADAFTTSSLTSFGRSLIDDADAAAARTTLGLGTMATQAANNVAITGGSIDGITFDGGSW